MRGFVFPVARLNKELPAANIPPIEIANLPAGAPLNPTHSPRERETVLRNERPARVRSHGNSPQPACAYRA